MPRAAGFYQILGAITSTLNYKWPAFTLNFLIWMRLFTLDLPALPFVGCLSRSSFVNSFFITTLAPPALIGFMILLHRMAMFTEYEVWCVSHRCPRPAHQSNFSQQTLYSAYTFRMQAEFDLRALPGVSHHMRDHRECFQML